MQANPAYLPIEMCYKSQGQQYMNVGLAQQNTEELIYIYDISIHDNIVD